MNENYQLLQNIILNETFVIPIVEKIKSYLFPTVKNKIEKEKKNLVNIEKNIQELKFTTGESQKIADTLDNFERARQESQVQLQELEKTLNIANTSFLGAAIVGSIGIGALFYYRWKLKENELEKQSLSKLQQQEAKKQFANEFMNQLEQTKVQANKFSHGTKSKIHNNIDKAKQRILNKVNR